jgi:hypothetical protein
MTDEKRIVLIVTDTGHGPAIACPHCWQPNDCHHCVNEPGAEPEPGNVSICWYCRKPYIITDTLGGRELTDEESLELESTLAPIIAAMLAADHPADVTVDP